MALPAVLLTLITLLHPVALTLSSRAVGHTAQVRALARVAPHDGNRRLCFEYRGPEDYRSCDELAGAKAPISYWRWWPGRNRSGFVPGDYAAAVELTRIEDGRERHYRDTATFTVIGPDRSWP